MCFSYLCSHSGEQRFALVQRPEPFQTAAVHCDSSYANTGVSHPGLCGGRAPWFSPFQGVPSSSPFLGSYFPHYGERGCSTTFSSSFYRRCPDFCTDIPSLVSWFSCQTNTPQDAIIVSRSYDWVLTYSSHASWRFNPMDKEVQQHQLPVLFMLQGFSSVALWGPSICPLSALSLSITMPPVEFVGSAGNRVDRRGACLLPTRWSRCTSGCEAALPT